MLKGVTITAHFIKLPYTYWRTLFDAELDLADNWTLIR
jgi:hypothetical protein